MNLSEKMDLINRDRNDKKYYEQIQWNHKEDFIVEDPYNYKLEKETEIINEDFNNDKEIYDILFDEFLRTGWYDTRIDHLKTKYKYHTKFWKWELKTKINELSSKGSSTKNVQRELFFRF